MLKVTCSALFPFTAEKQWCGDWQAKSAAGVEPGTVLHIEPVMRRFWWPHPLACIGNQGGVPCLWRNRPVSYRYFVNGVECDSTGTPL